MFEEPNECFSLDATASLPLEELAVCCGMTTAELDELIDYSALAPLDEAGAERVFSAHWVVPLRTVARLRLDFDLDLFAVAMVLGNLDRIARLEQEVQSLRALLPAHRPAMHHE